MKTIALICMIIDHIGMIFFPEYILFRVIGRLAMPIFAFCVARGAYYTHSLERYIGRMALFFAISELPYYKIYHLVNPGVTGFPLNIGATFLIALTIIFIIRRGIRENRRLRILEIVMIVALILLSDFIQVDYQSYGVLTVVMSYLLYARGINETNVFPYIVGYLLMTFMWYLGSFSGFLLQGIGALGYGIIFLTRSRNERKLGRLFYIMYPLHLCILYMIDKMM